MNIIFVYMIALYFPKFSTFYNHCIYYSNHQIIFLLPYLTFPSPNHGDTISMPRQLSPRRSLTFPLVSAFSQHQNLNFLSHSNATFLDYETTIENYSTLLTNSRWNIVSIYSTYNMTPSLPTHYSAYTYHPVPPRFPTFLLILYPT